MSETGKATPAEILRTIGHMLSAITHFPGRLLYSGMDTIRPGDLYVLGMNPGGRFTLNPPLNQTIGFTLAEARQRWSFLDDEPDPPAAGLLQARVKGVLEDLNCNPRETLVTNAVFVRAGDVEQFGKLGLSFWQLWWNLCWPVHQILLGAVRPKLVLCFGNVAHEALSTPSPPEGGRYQRPQINPDAADPSRPDRWFLDLGSDGLLETSVLVLPHPSPRNTTQWRPDGRLIREEDRRRLENARGLLGD